jgi:GH18 family chitinase
MDSDAGVPYTFSQGLWISYDNKESITKKVRYWNL